MPGSSMMTSGRERLLDFAGAIFAPRYFFPKVTWSNLPSYNFFSVNEPKFRLSRGELEGPFAAFHTCGSLYPALVENKFFFDGRFF